MKNCFAYIRVSTAKQGQYGSSLQEQRDAIAAFAKRHDLSISEWFEDRETAAKKGRTQFMRMMTALEKRKAAGVILHKIDRGARNLWDWARIQDLIDAGVEVQFAHDNLDLKSRGGRLAADIQAVVAADYVRNLREEVRKGIRGRLKQGIYPCRAPAGYLDQGKAKVKIIDPIKGPLVRAAFELYATKRYSYETLAAELQRRGLRRSSGQPLSLNGISTILRNPFYTGIIRLKSTGEVFQGIHEPIIEASTFQIVQDIIDGKDNAKVRRFDFTYRRLLSCGLCGSRLTGETQKGNTYYRCHTRDCETTGVREDIVGARLRAATALLTFTEEDLREMEPYIDQEEQAHEGEQAKVIAALKLRVANLEDRERRVTDAYIDQALNRAAYDERKSAILMELASARDDLRHAERDASNGGAARVRRFFEPLKTLEIGPGIENRAAFRDAVEKLTSNRTLVRKNLTFALRSPFREVVGDMNLLTCEPSRGTFRKRTSHSTPTKNSAGLVEGTLNEKRASIILKHLRDWKSPPSLSIPEEVRPARQPQPQWFKRKPPQIEDHP